MPEKSREEDGQNELKGVGHNVTLCINYTLFQKKKILEDNLLFQICASNGIKIHFPVSLVGRNTVSKCKTLCKCKTL